MVSKKWATGSGTVFRTRNCSLNFKLVKLSVSRTVKRIFNADKTETSQKSLGYAMTIGIDIMNELRLTISCEEKIVEWKNLKIPMTTSATKF